MSKSSAVSLSGSSPGSSGCALLFGLPFLAGGCMIVWFYTSLVWNAARARVWTAHSCTIESANLEVDSNSEGCTVKAVARYRWEWKGRTHRSSRVSFDSGRDNLDGFQQRASNELVAAIGKPGGFQCWINPSNPSEAVIYRGVRWAWAVFMVPFLFAFPFVGMLMCLFSRRGWAADFAEDQGMRSSAALLSSAWGTITLGLVFGSLFLTDDWTAGRVVITVLTGIAFGVVLRYFRRAVNAVRRLGRDGTTAEVLALETGDGENA